jgi:hypothetical protein
MQICTAMASGISREAVKSGCARDWGGWGRLSVDGPGQNNPDRSEGPWGRAAWPARTEVFISALSLTQSRESRWQQRARRAMANQPAGKALSESPALKPYRGKLAVRNFRGGNGDVGIIRSPVRAIALPDSRRRVLVSWTLTRNSKLRDARYPSKWRSYWPLAETSVPGRTKSSASAECARAQPGESVAAAAAAEKDREVFADQPAKMAGEGRR